MQETLIMLVGSLRNAYIMEESYWEESEVWKKWKKDKKGQWGEYNHNILCACMKLLRNKLENFKYASKHSSDPPDSSEAFYHFIAIVLIGSGLG